MSYIIIIAPSNSTEQHDHSKEQTIGPLIALLPSAIPNSTSMLETAQGFTIIADSAELKALLTDGTIKLGMLIAEIKQWKRAINDGPRIVLEAIPIREIVQ